MVLPHALDRGRVSDQLEADILFCALTAAFHT